MNETLKAVQDFAGKAHGEQMRHYTPDRYIVHPIRVMQLCTEYTQDETLLAAALLHDVLEDTQVNKEAMLCFLLSVMEEDKAKRTLGLVIELTDVYTKKKYPTWNAAKERLWKPVALNKPAAKRKPLNTPTFWIILTNCRKTMNSALSFLKSAEAC